MARAKRSERIEQLRAELHVPPLPPPLHYLLGAYLRLSRRRSHNGFGPLPLSWSDIDAFQRVTGFRLTPWEIDLIDQLDRLELSAAANVKQGQSDGS